MSLDSVRHDLETRRSASIGDEALVTRVARGDEAALAALYDRHGNACYGLALRVVRDNALAEDVVQEAFLAAWRSARTFEPNRGSARVWLLMLVHRRAVDLVRREQRRRVGVGFLEPVGDDPPDLTTERSLEAARVRDAVKQLPSGRREVVALTYYVGLTHNQVAGRTGKPLGTVKSSIFSGLEQLRGLLEPG